jgi:protein-disulfide isomerase
MTRSLPATRRPRAAAVLVSLASLLGVGATTTSCLAQEGTAQPGGADDPAQVLAVVDGKPITAAQVRAAAAAQLEQMEREYRKNERQVIENQLQQLVEQRLLAAEAGARGVSEQEVLAELAITAVSDADVDAFYEQNRAQIPRPKEQVAAQIRQYLEQQRQADAREGLFRTLQGKYGVDIKLEPDRVAVAAVGPAKGPENAPVTIVEFSDFQCPFCARLVPTLDQVMAKYGDQVRLVFRQYPLSFHQHAQKAAEASLCAHEQGRFWELHDAMFRDQQRLAVDNLKATAAEVGIEPEAFAACLDSGRYADEVQVDFREGTAAGVSGTPALFVNGRFISGAVPLEQITPVIDDELRRKGAGTTATGTGGA